MRLRKFFQSAFQKTPKASESPALGSAVSIISGQSESIKPTESLKSTRMISHVSSVHEPSGTADLHSLIPQTTNVSSTECLAADSTSSPQTADLISNIPIELINSILHFLPTPSAAALSLCSRGLLAKLGTKYIDAINRGKGFKIPQIYGHLNYSEEVSSRMTTDQRERQSFLLLLQKELPDEIFCYHCQVIHSPIKTDWDSNQRPCSKANKARNMYHQGFNFSQIQMAMKRHRLGLDPSAQLEALSQTFNHPKRGYTDLMKSKARIISGSVWLRTQHWAILPRDGDKLPTLRNIVPICWHWRDPDFYFNRLDQDPIACRVSHEFRTPCEMCVGMHNCDKCATEIQVDTKKTKRGFGMAVVVTVWKKLGEGETPFDPTWMSHWENLWHTHYSEFAFEMPGKIKRVFEDGKPFVFDAHLSPREQKILGVVPGQNSSKLRFSISP